MAYEQEIYSASRVASATTFWDLAYQWISPDKASSSLALVYTMPNTHPPTDLRVVKFPAQSESDHGDMTILRTWVVRMCIHRM